MSISGESIPCRLAYPSKRAQLLRGLTVTGNLMQSGKRELVPAGERFGCLADRQSENCMPELRVDDDITLIV